MAAADARLLRSTTEVEEWRSLSIHGLGQHVYKRDHFTSLHFTRGQGHRKSLHPVLVQERTPSMVVIRPGLAEQGFGVWGVEV